MWSFLLRPCHSSITDLWQEEATIKQMGIFLKIMTRHQDKYTCPLIQQAPVDGLCVQVQCWAESWGSSGCAVVRSHPGLRVKEGKKMLSRINRHPAELKCKLSFKTHVSFKGLNKEAWSRASQDLSEELLPCREWGQSRNVNWTPCTQQSETKAHLLLPWWLSFHEMEMTWSCNKGD